jgi:hypothetical protein
MPNDLSTAKSDYLTNSDYDLSGSVAKAKLFVSACRALLLLLPKRSRQSGHEIETDPAVVQKAEQNALRWLAENDTATTGSGKRYFSLEDFRA